MLSQAEIDAILRTSPVSDDADALPLHAIAPGRTVKTYDFRRPDKFSKDQLRTLQAIHENVARIAGARLGASLRSPVSIQLATCEQTVFDEYIAGLDLPTQLVVLRAGPLAGPMLLELDLRFAFAGIERMLGGHGTLPTERREPTAIEGVLIRRLVDEIVPAIAEAWAHLTTFPIEIIETALGPALLRVAAPSEVAAVLAFEIRFGGRAATFTVIYPHAAVEPILPRLSATAWYAQTDRDGESEASRPLLEEALDHIEIAVTAVLGAVELPVDTLADLQLGDVIRLDERIADPIRIWISDQVRAWGIPGRIDDRLAVQLVAPLTPVEA
ncbi:MAG: flagellar motor switch protein FliM [Anaerolinea sp.]|nr:flagellar motor switch protein FliM [Anaerolinea sp.]